MSRRQVRLAAAPRVASREPVPFEDLSALERSAVEEAIVVAWSRVPVAAKRAGIDLSTADEEPITRLLREALDAIRRDPSNPVPGFSEREFQHIPESEAVQAMGGLAGESMVLYPDLVVRPCVLPASVPLGRTVDYGLVIECKILDAARDHHDVRTYCSQGLLRFLSGGYAAAMPSGMLLGYVRGDWSIPEQLARHLADERYAREYQVRRLPELAGHRTPARVPVYASLHGREEVMVWGRHAAGDISVTHLWLRC